MTLQRIHIGTYPNDGTGDTLRTSFTKVNDNFLELYNGLGSLANTANVINVAAQFSTNVIFEHANAAFMRANASFAYAVEVAGDVGYAFMGANLAFNAANGAAANAIQSVEIANAASIVANGMALQIRAINDRINTVIQQAETLNASILAAGSQTGRVYNVANAIHFKTNTSFSHTNVAFIQANVARSHANAAFLRANIADSQVTAKLSNTSGVSFAGNLFFPTGSLGIGKSSASYSIDTTGSIRAITAILGVHPNYNNDVALWREGSDYAVRMGASETYINAPSGKLNFRKGNINSGYFDESQNFFAKNLYDLDDPNYYVDPDQTSRLSVLEVADEISAGALYSDTDRDYYVKPSAETSLNKVSSVELSSTNTRANELQKYPVGRYAPDGTLFDIDPTWSQDQLRAFFKSNRVSWVADATAPGGYAIAITGEVVLNETNNQGFPYIPIGDDDIFYMEIWIKNVLNDNYHSLGSSEFNQSLAFISGNPDHGRWVMNQVSPGLTGSGWKKYSGYISGFAAANGAARTRFINGAKYWSPYALFNKDSVTGVTHISGWKIVKISRPGGIAADSVRLNNVKKLAQSPYNGFLMLQGQNVYTASALQSVGATSYYQSRVVGRGTDVITDIGLDSMRVVPIPEETGSGAYIVDAGTNGYQFAYALFNNGNLYTWGNNSSGQCGLGHNNRAYVPTLADFNVTDVYISPTNASNVTDTKVIIRKTDGYLYAAGYNANGQLGLGDTSNRSVFTLISSLGNTIKSVWNLGATRGCLVVQKGDDTIWVAGSNHSGELGLGNTTRQVTPVDVTSAWGGGAGKILTKVIYGSDASSYGNWMGMLLSDGETSTLRMSGYNGYYTLGTNTTTNSSTPVTPNVGTGLIIDIAGFGGGPGTVYALKSDGNLYAWGYNNYGQCGVGSTSSTIKAPTLATTNVREIFCNGNDNHNNAWITQGFVRKDDGLYATGYNGRGELGLGDSTDRNNFAKVRLPANFHVQLLGWYCAASGVKSYVAKATDGRLYVWGYNGGLDAINQAAGSADYTSPVQLNIPIGA